ncbi:MAG: ATP-binding protein [Firmicutes bacterium]|nr:ATP-binding protein [Bacillota bacterium]
MAALFENFDSVSFPDLETWLTDPSPPSESERLDFKRDFSQSVTESIVGMANHDGGIILIGVDEDRSKTSSKQPLWPPPGIPTASAEERLSNRCYQDIRPTYRPKSRTIPLPHDPSRCILAIWVDAESAPRPLWHYQKGVLYRVGDQNHPADLESLRRLFSADEYTRDPRASTYLQWASNAAMANADGYWLTVVARFSDVPPVFDSQVKTQLKEFVLRRFPIRTAAPISGTVSSYQWRSAYGLFEARDAIDGVRERFSTPHVWLRFNSQGVVAFEARGQLSPIPLQWVTHRLASMLSSICEDDTLQRIFPGFYCSDIQLSLSNWPEDGITPEGLFSAEKTVPVHLNGYRLAQHYGPLRRAKEPLLDIAIDFVIRCLDDSGYLHHEDSVKQIAERWLWQHSPVPWVLP